MNKRNRKFYGKTHATYKAWDGGLTWYEPVTDSRKRRKVGSLMNIARGIR